jgi:hypothetical protein
MYVLPVRIPTNTSEIANFPVLYRFGFIAPLLCAVKGPTYPSHGCKHQATGHPEHYERSQYQEPQGKCIGVSCNQRLSEDPCRHKVR